MLLLLLLLLLSALVDTAIHSVDDVENLDITVFEQQQLLSLGMPSGIIMRHRLPHFQRYNNNNNNNNI